MAWLTGWRYRKSITLSRASGAVTDYQMKLLVGESSGATGEDVDCNSHILSDFDDLRFTSDDGTTLLDYWIESITGTTPNRLATVWIEFGTIGTGATTFYMYYGKASASVVSNGTNTFVVYDDMETDGWTASENKADFTESWSEAAAHTPTHSYLISFPSSTVGNAGNYGRYTKTIDVGTGNRAMVLFARDSRTGTTGYWYKEVYVGGTRYYRADVGADAVNAFLSTGELDISVKTGSQSVYFQMIIAATISNVSIISYWDTLYIIKKEPTGPAWGSWGSEEHITARAMIWG
ncbi:MAG: DUF2341 domain-containing protein [Parcubacteria group bacterium]